MRICKNCGNELSDGVTVCQFCGWVAEDTVECQNAVSQNDESKQTGKKWKFIGILGTIAIIIIFRVIGSHIGEYAGKKIAENNYEKDIEEFIEQMAEYVPGHCDGNKYISEKFGFKFTIDENWEFYSAEDLAASSVETKANTTESALDALEKEDVPRDLKDKFIESIYAETEMGALYMADDMYVGEVLVGVMSVYGVEDISIEEYISEIRKAFNANSQVSDEYLAGSTYKVISVNVIDVNGIDTMVKMYIKKEGNMICMITCRAVVGYEEQVFRAFENRISSL